jgi:DNA-binding CsgD family transcriptional regulator
MGRGGRRYNRDDDLSDGYLSERGRRSDVALPLVKPPDLTVAERTCLLLVSHGLQVKQIADWLDVPYDTAKSRLKSAQHKLSASNAPHAACLALRAGLID